MKCGTMAARKVTRRGKGTVGMVAQKPHAIFIAGALLAFAAFTAPAQAQSRSFACENRHGIVTITATGQNAITIGPVQASTVTLKRSRNDPLYYVNGDNGVRMSPSRTEIDVEIPDFGTVHCRYAPAGSALAMQAMAENPCGPAERQLPETDRCVDINASPAEAQLPMWGASLGGILRTGPGIIFSKIASLREGERVQIVHSTEEVMGGYDWFAVRYKGRDGYQWGGIMCSDDPLPAFLRAANSDVP
jgi:hypothetical protein